MPVASGSARSASSRGDSWSISRQASPTIEAVAPINGCAWPAGSSASRPTPRRHRYRGAQPCTQPRRRRDRCRTGCRGGARRLPTDDEGVAIHQCFIVLLQMGELASYLTRKEERIDVVVTTALRRVARLIEQGSCIEAVRALDEQATEFASTLDSRTRQLVARAFRAPERATLVAEQPFRSTIHRLPLFDRCRFAILLAGAIVVATVIAHTLDGPSGIGSR